MNKNPSLPSRPHIKLSANEITPVLTSHNTGSKIVLSKGSDQPVLIKQVAIGRLKPGEAVEPHTHPDMDEQYFILGGAGTMRVDNETYVLKSGDFILVTAGSEHELQCNSDTNETLEFYYQGFQILTTSNRVSHA